MLIIHICDYCDAYIVVTGETTVAKIVFTIDDFVAPNNTQSIVTAINTANTDNVIDKQLAFKNIVPFISCVSKINNVFIENAEDLDVVMPMYSLIEYSKNHSKTEKIIQTVMELLQI